jgi:predicted GNAT family N-acyltransferase
MQTFLIQEVTWNSENQAKLKEVREVVFIQEQCVPTHIEWDELDAVAIHLLALDTKNLPIGCARILKHGRVGRMAVVKSWRGTGLGKALLAKAIEICRRLNMPKINISSQTHAIQFYEKAGFIVTSGAYIDANIWHVDMELILS